MITETRRFVQRGNIVLVKRDMPAEQLTDKDILTHIQQHNAELKRIKEEKDKSLKYAVSMDEKTDFVNNSLKDFKKFEKWATKLQVSKLNVIIDENMAAAIEEVDKLYVVNNSKDKAWNAAKKYEKLQDIIGRLPEVAEKISKEIMTKYIFTDCMFKNPWNLTE